MVKLRPHRQVTAIDFSHLKLAKCFYGPFQILSQIGQIAYKLHLPEGSCIHSIFHCSTLKPYHQPSSSSDSPIALPTRTLTTNPSFHHLCSWACGGNRSRASNNWRYWCNGKGCIQMTQHGKIGLACKTLITLRTRCCQMGWGMIGPLLRLWRPIAGVQKEEPLFQPTWRIMSKWDHGLVQMILVSC